MNERSSPPALTEVEHAPRPRCRRWERIGVVLLIGVWAVVVLPRLLSEIHRLIWDPVAC